ncbi:LysM peptidoglycan-binding domain-containing protein [Bradyrhizobium sp. SZCCHNS30582]|uniref:LysM peptidoglycan-binding domain-containing protein n=2 Tax=unclassified Bradyrhizobium TaxID=2631580 RepID=UPI0029167F4D|nr:LysM peptidoglycan-binding domain-containing protein [Bradyrhizobium sp. SZCCHNS30582]
MLDRNSTHSVGSSSTAPLPLFQPARPIMGPVLQPTPVLFGPPVPPKAVAACPGVPAPASAAPVPDAVSQAKAVQTKAQTTLDGDAGKLHKLQSELTDAQGTKAPIGYGRGAGAAAAAHQTHINDLKKQVAAAQQQVTADQAVLSSAKSNLSAAQRIDAAAANYKPAPPPVTVKDPVARKVAPLVDAASAQVSAGKAKVTADTAALEQTKSQLGRLDTEMDRGISAGTLHRLSLLNQQQDAQQHKLATDQRKLDAAGADLAAGKSVVYGQQAAADKKELESASTALKKAGVTIDQNENPTQADLTPSQLRAYDDFTVARSKLNADVGMVAQGKAQLQYYASNSEKYGTVAKDAQDRVNDALHPLGYTVRATRGSDPQQASLDLKLANGNADYQNAGWAAAQHRVAFAAAAQTDLEAAQDSDLAKLSPQARQTATTAKIDYDQASAYQNKVGTDLALIKGHQAVSDAQAAYIKNPTAATELKLNQAQHQLRELSTMSDIATAGFKSATGLAYADRRNTTLANLEQTYSHVPLPSNSPVLQQIAQARTDAASAGLITKELAATTNRLVQDYRVTQSEAAVATARQSANTDLVQAGNVQAVGFTKAGSALTTAQQSLQYAQLQQKLAQYQLLDSQFRLTLPQNLLDPQTAADQSALSHAYNTFFAQHPGALSDGAVAEQLASLKDANARVDIGQGLHELQDAIGREDKALGNRSLLQKGGDWVGGLFGANRSELESDLQDKKEALTALQKNQRGMTAQEVNGEYLKIMGNLATQNDRMFENERKTDANWSSAQEVVRDVAIAAAATAVTMATAGAGAPVLAALAAGTLVGTGTAEAIDTAQNAATVFGGGDIHSNSHISLDAALTNNFFKGGGSWDEVKQAGVDATVSGVQSLGAAGGALTGGATEAFITRGLDQAASSVVSKLATGSTVMVANQGVLGLGNVAGTYVESQYQLSEGRLTQDEANAQMKDAFSGYFKNVAMAGVTGGLTKFVDGKVAVRTASAARPNGLVSNPLYQTASQLGANTMLTAGPGLLSGKAPTTQDYLSIGLNTVSGVASHHYQQSRSRTATEAGLAGQPAALDAGRKVFDAYQGRTSGSAPNGIRLQAMDPADFARAYQKAGGQHDPAAVDAFSIASDQGHRVYVRTDRLSPDVVAHEAVHALTSESFKKLASTLVVDSSRPHSNLNEGVTEFLASQVVPRRGTSPYATEAKIAEAIRDRMGETDFHKAVFGGDPAALASFRQTALGLQDTPISQDHAADWALAASTTPQAGGGAKRIANRLREWVAAAPPAAASAAVAGELVLATHGAPALGEAIADLNPVGRAFFNSPLAHARVRTWLGSSREAAARAVVASSFGTNASINFMKAASGWHTDRAAAISDGLLGLGQAAFALRNGVSSQALMRSRGTKVDVLPGDTMVSIAQRLGLIPRDLTRSNPSVQDINPTVTALNSSGATWAEIAKREGVDVKTLVALNLDRHGWSIPARKDSAGASVPAVDDARVQAGQSPQEFLDSHSTSLRSIAKANAKNVAPAEILVPQRLRQVTNGVTYGEFATDQGLSLKRLLEANGHRGLSIPPRRVYDAASGGRVLRGATTDRLQPGESLESFARRHGVGIKKLITANKDSRAPLRIDVPGQASSASNPTAVTWEQIAKKTGVPLRRLLSMSGQNLHVPGQKQAVDLQPGQSLRDLAKEHGTTVRKIVSENRTWIPQTYELPRAGAWVGDKLSVDRVYDNRDVQDPSKGRLTWVQVARRTGRTTKELMSYNKASSANKKDLAPPTVNIPTKSSWETSTKSGKGLQFVGAIGLVPGNLVAADVHAHAGNWALIGPDVGVAVGVGLAATRSAVGSVAKSGAAKKWARARPRDAWTSGLSFGAKGLIKYIESFRP